VQAAAGTVDGQGRRLFGEGRAHRMTPSPMSASW
jgi:hypothetical protein